MTIASLWGHQLKELVLECVVMLVGRLGRDRLIPVKVIFIQQNIDFIYNINKNINKRKT